jgi:NADH-quinone oxidoreductase subunit J
MLPVDIAFIFLSGICISGAFLMILAKDVLYAALGLLATLLGVAGLFLIGGAEFLAVSQIMVYAGGIIVLILFGVMITNGAKPIFQRSIWKQRTFQLVLVFLLFLLFGAVALTQWHPDPNLTIRHLTIKQIGFGLLTQYLFPFEFSIVLLLAALVGASVVAVRK